MQRALILTGLGLVLLATATVLLLVSPSPSAVEVGPPHVELRDEVGARSRSISSSGDEALPMRGAIRSVGGEGGSGRRPLSRPRVRLRGSLHDQDSGAPLGGYVVRAMVDEQVVVATTGDDGRFSFEETIAPGPLSLRLDEDPTCARSPEWLVEDAFWLYENEEERELELLASIPEAVVRVIPRLPTGAAAVGASIALYHQWSFVVTRSCSHGAASFGVQVRPRPMSLTLSGTDGEHAFGPITVDGEEAQGWYELPGRLGAKLTVRVRDRYSVPMEGVLVSCGDTGPHQRETLTNGEVHFGGVLAGPCTIVARWRETSLEQRIELEAGETRTIEITLPLDSTPVLLASGRVVTEDGDPVANVRIGDPSDVVFSSTHTDENGEFVFLGLPRKRVKLSAFLPGARFEPPDISVARGKTGVEFRRIAEAPPLKVEVVDAETGRSLPRAKVSLWLDIDRQGHGFLTAFATWSADSREPFYRPFFPPQHGVCAHPGYRRRSLDVPEMMVNACGAAPYRIALEPGLYRELHIKDESTSASVVGVELVDGEEVVGTTDDTGRVILDLPTWPEALTVRAEGYVTRRWRPLDSWQQVLPPVLDIAPTEGAGE